MLEFRILGPVEVVCDGRLLPLGGAKQRALVADLTLHANEVLSSDRLIDDLWGEDPPETAGHLLHVYVSRLRKTFEGDGQAVLVTRTPGYLLRLEPPDELDAATFELESRRGTELLDARPAEALETLDRALGMWRGRALEEFAGDAFAQPSVARLEDLRQATHERRVEALLALGRHDEAFAELEGLIARFPLRERLRELQMLALYRSGRQGDALQAFQAARRTLADELGVDPSPRLVALEQAVLRHDPELEAPARAVASVPPTGPPALGPAEDHPTPSRRWVPATAIVTVAAIAVAVAVASLASPGREPTRSPGSSPSDGTSPSPSSSSSPSGAIASGDLSWTEVPDPGFTVFGGLGDQIILGGVGAPDGMILVGYSAIAPGSGLSKDFDAAVWMGSPSGGWARDIDPAFAAPGNQKATDAVLLPGRAVVVGSDASRGDHDAAVWTLEEDASAWARVPPEAPGMSEPGDQWVRAVTWTGSYAIAVGLSRTETGEDVAIWRSTDGRDWTLLVPTNLGLPADQEMSCVTRYRHLVVAAGFDEASGNRDAAIWTSRDGVDWQPVAAEALHGEGDQQINAIVAVGTRLVAVGQETIDGDQDAAVWISADGRRWGRVADPAGSLGGAGSQQMSGVAASGGLLVAAGTEIAGTDTDGAIWTSTDGASWQRVPPTVVGMSSLSDYGRQWVRALIATDDGFLALGREGREDDDADVWIGRPAG